MFHLFIKKVGRIPASDGFAVRRIAGPGLFQDYYFAIRPEQALAAFEAKMELDELQVRFLNYFVVGKLQIILHNILTIGIHFKNFLKLF